MHTTARRRLTVLTVTGALLAGTALSATQAAAAAVPIDPDGLANTLFASTLRVADREEDRTRHLVASAELLDWRARNPQADANAARAHLAGVRTHLNPAATLGAALVVVRAAPGAIPDGPQLTRLQHTLIGLDAAPVTNKPEDRVGGALPQFEFAAAYPAAQAEVWAGLAATARRDAALRTAWNTELGNQLRVDAGAGAAQLGQGEALRAVLDVPKLLAAANLGPAELRAETLRQFTGLTTRLRNESRVWAAEFTRVAKENPPDATPVEPTEAQREAARKEEAARRSLADGVHGGLDALAWVVGAADRDLSRQLGRFAPAAHQTADALIRAITAAKLVSAAPAQTPVAFTGNLIGAVAGLVAVFGGTAPSVAQPILEEIQAIRVLLENLQQPTADRLTKADSRLAVIFPDLLAELRKLGDGVAYVREHTRQIIGQLGLLSGWLQLTYPARGKAIDGMLALGMWSPIEEYVDYRRNHGTDLPRPEFPPTAGLIRANGITGPANPTFVVRKEDYSTDPTRVAELLRVRGEEGGAAGLLAHYAKHAPGLDPAFQAPGEGGNPWVWGNNATAYALLIKQNPALAKEFGVDQPGATLLNAGRQLRDHGLAFSRPGPNGAVNTLFQGLLANYQTQTDQLLASIRNRAAEVSEGKRLDLWRGPEQGAPADAALTGPDRIGPCTPSPDPALNVPVTRPANHNGHQLKPETQFYRYFRGVTYAPCHQFQLHPRPGQPSARDLHLTMFDLIRLPDGAVRLAGRTDAVVYRGFNHQPSAQEVATVLREHWDRELRLTFERTAIRTPSFSGPDTLLPEARELLRQKQIEYYGKVADALQNGTKEFQLAARLLRHYTELGFPQAANADEFLRAALRGSTPLLGLHPDTATRLAEEYTLAQQNLRAGKPAWDPARSDQPNPCATTAGADPVTECLAANLTSRKDRLTARLTAHFRLRAQGSDESLPGTQEQLRTLWLALKSLYPERDFGAPER